MTNEKEELLEKALDKLNNIVETHGNKLDGLKRKPKKIGEITSEGLELTYPANNPNDPWYKCFPVGSEIFVVEPLEKPQ